MLEEAQLQLAEEEARLAGAAARVELEHAPIPELRLSGFGSRGELPQAQGAAPAYGAGGSASTKGKPPVTIAVPPERPEVIRREPWPCMRSLAMPEVWPCMRSRAGSHGHASALITSSILRLFVWLIGTLSAIQVTYYDPPGSPPCDDFGPDHNFLNEEPAEEPAEESADEPSEKPAEESSYA